ncbi:MAG TPA: NADH-quinone oxidoreductase subunit J [Saprospiraceae bacterium]|nr:NADH-quinone oxidoreductase subunit J [Saprospiraceae bacterium]
MGEAAVYVLSYFVSVFSIYRAVTDRNPVFSVLYLILSFLSLASLLIFLSADYLGVLLILVYGGAISILIMFVIMMLDLKQLQVESVPRLRLMTFVAFIVSFFSSVYLA